MIEGKEMTSGGNKNERLHHNLFNKWCVFKVQNWK